MSTRTNYLTVTTVAEMLAVSKPTVRRRIATGELPAVRLTTEGRGAVRIPADALERWLEHRRIPPTPTPPAA